MAEVVDEATKTPTKPIFRDIDADEDDPDITEIESLCLECHENGMTRLFLTKIPFFREVILSSFSCDHCGFSNCQLQPGGAIQEKGVVYTMEIKEEEDLNRQIVQTDKATISIPSLEFEAPPSKGILTTVEGIINGAVEGLSLCQPDRREECPEIATKIDDVIMKLALLKTLREPFKIILDDPTGNSFIENPHAPKSDPNTVVMHYTRTHDQDVALALVAEDAEEKSEEKKEDDVHPKDANIKDDVISFPTNCPNCNVPCSTRMKMVKIPHFKEVIIMATNCESCGHRTNEVKSGSGIEPKGCRTTLKITDITDMSRDVLKSETCRLAIPDLDFDTDFGTLGGRFTTIEGLLHNVKENLLGPNSFIDGDSAVSVYKTKLRDFCDKLDKIIEGKMMGVSFVLDDPAGNSYLQNVYAPEDDPEMEVIHYERDYEQNEFLGLNDMKTENYEKL